jgi:hypothetical protein
MELFIQSVHGGAGLSWNVLLLLLILAYVLPVRA